MNNRFLLLFTIPFLSLLSCGETEVREFSFTTDFAFEGPLFEGPNTAQYTLEKIWDDFLSAQQIERSDIKSVSLTSAQITLDSKLETSIVSDLGLTFASDEIEMIQVAGLNPLPADANQVELTISNEVDVTPFFKQPRFIVLLDAGITEELYDNYTASARFNFSVQVKVD
jgi:hypothetical protein